MGCVARRVAFLHVRLCSVGVVRSCSLYQPSCACCLVCRFVDCVSPSSVVCACVCSFSSSSSRLKPLNSKVISWLFAVPILAQASIEAAFLLDLFFLFFDVFLIFV